MMATVTAAETTTRRVWRRFTSAQRTARFMVYLVIVAAIVAAAQTIEIIPEFLADAPEQIGDLLARMWPIDWRAYRTDVHSALIETIHIASLGTLLAFGYWPQVKPAFWSIALFRFDINVRESAVLGLVGAGGIGTALDAALNLFQWGRVALILVAILIVVVLTEIVVTQIRKRML